MGETWRLVVFAILLTGCPPLPTLTKTGPCPVNEVYRRGPDGKPLKNEEKLCPVDSYNKMVRCQRMRGLVKKHSVGEMVKVMQEAAKQGLRVRALGSRHTITTQFCTDGYGIDMKALKPRDPAKRVVLKGSIAETWTGLTMNELSEWLALKEKSIGFSVIGFRDATVGGVLANGAHGSALTESTLLASRVRGLTMIDASGALKHYRWDGQQVQVAPGAEEIGAPVGAEMPLQLPGDVTQKDAWGALISAVGMLGIVVRVEIEVEDAFYLWVRVQRHESDQVMDHIGELAHSMAIRPSVAPGDDRIAPRCEFFQILWYPNVHKLFTMCGVKVKRELVGRDLVEMLGRGKLGKDRYVMADVLVDDAQNKQYLEQLYLQDDPEDTTQNPFARSLQKPSKVHWKNVLDVDNTVLNPSFEGLLRSFAKWGHRFLNYAWPFAKDDPDLIKRCGFVEGQRWSGAIFTQKGGKGLDGEDFSVLGPSHRLISSQIADEGRDVTQLDYEIAIPEANWDHSLAALKKRIADESLCLPMTGVFIRFSQVDDRTLIAHAAEGGKLYKKGTRIMFLDFVVYAPIVQEAMNSAAYDRERKYHEAYRLAAEHLIRAYGGRPHWGKNADWWPLNQREWCGKSLFHIHRECSADGRCDPEYAERLQRFQKVIDVFDPNGRFENEFARDAGLVRSAQANEGLEQSARCP